MRPLQRLNRSMIALWSLNISFKSDDFVGIICRLASEGIISSFKMTDKLL
jgi:hypothetical protein